MIAKDTLRDYTTFRRMWDIFFYIASIRRSVPLDEIHKLFQGKWHIKTIRRDLQLLEDYGIWRTRSYDGDYPCYRFMGSRGPFLRQTGKKWCYSCRSFVSIQRFGKLQSSIDGRQNQCQKCKRTIDRQYYRRNRRFHLNRQKRYYKSKIKRQLIAEFGLCIVPGTISGNVAKP